MERLILAASKGCTIEQAAEAAAMKPRTLKDWLAKYPDFRKAWDEAKKVSVEAVEGVLYRCALKAEFDPRYQASLFTFLKYRSPTYKDTEIKLHYKAA